MLAMSSLFSSTFEFPLEDHHNWQSVNDSFGNFKDDKTLQSLDSFGSSSPLENYDELNNTKRSTSTSSDPSSSKKLNHNASERDRRKKLNDLYSTLRSLLPRSDQKKKLSIPSSITQALKYIPQLQNQVEKLVQRKEEILSRTSDKQNNVAYHSIKKIKQGPLGQSLPNVAVNTIDDNEIVVQICTTKINRSHHFSNILQSLEKDELQILNASTFASCENKVFYTLHVQVKKTQRMECEMLSEKILSLC
ncbi:Transcription factor org2 [Thalictrum thalictroides]|uniref:Transcription factor org2 n=1 Tax=Thalictrum thalictroides TaxID=46969 RepID=A0A7J6W5U0_THATH|nr:Transcription factor org2 [Thalictrum thalictroides]